MPPLQVVAGVPPRVELEKEGSTWKGSPLGGFLEIVNRNLLRIPRCNVQAKGMIGA